MREYMHGVRIHTALFSARRGPAAMQFKPHTLHGTSATTCDPDMPAYICTAQKNLKYLLDIILERAIELDGYGATPRCTPDTGGQCDDVLGEFAGAYVALGYLLRPSIDVCSEVLRVWRTRGARDEFVAHAHDMTRRVAASDVATHIEDPHFARNLYKDTDAAIRCVLKAQTGEAFARFARGAQRVLSALLKD